MTLTTAVDDYAVWTALLRGEHADTEARVAYCGHWRMRSHRNGQLVPVSIWRSPDGAIVGRVGRTGIAMTIDERWCENVMAYCIRDPVTQEAYDHYMQHGRWPDDAPGHAIPASNLPKDEALALKVQVDAEFEELQHELDAAESDAIFTEERIRRLENWRIRFHQLQTVCETLRREEKRPYDQAAAAVQAKYSPLYVKCGTAKLMIDSRTTAYLLAKQKRIDDAIGTAPAYDIPAEDVTAAVQTVGGRVGLKTRWKAEIWDYDLALQACKHHPEVEDAVQSVANQAARAKDKIPMPGVTFVPVKTAH
jgi:hypothetical protein